MKLIKGLLMVIVIAALIPIAIMACENRNDENAVSEPEKTEAEQFAEGNEVSIDFATSLESALTGMQLTDTTHVGVFHYDLSDVYNFEQTYDWAEGERYKMWMDMEHVWYVYCKGDSIVGIRDSQLNFLFQAE